MKKLLLISVFALSTANVTASTLQYEDKMCFGVIEWGWDVIGKDQLGYMNRTYNVLQSKYTKDVLRKNKKVIRNTKNDLSASFKLGKIDANDVLEMLGMCQNLAGVK